MKKYIMCGVIIITTAFMSLDYSKYFDGNEILERAPRIVRFKTNRTNKGLERKSTHLQKKKGEFFGLFPSINKIIDNLPEEMKKEEMKNETKINTQEEKSLKKILYWNDFDNNIFSKFGFGRGPFKIGECQYDNCFTTASRDRFQPSEVDAVIWNLRSDDKTLPNKSEFANARFIFFMIESAHYTYANVQDFNNIFDTTFTYKGDSNIPYPYGIISQRVLPNETLATKDFNAGRTNIAAWFVSHCSAAVSERMVLVDTLKKYLDIDIYGSCGPLQCPKDKHNECFKMVEKKYFFYLAFENSLCKDYITEKFFGSMSYEIIPVVYGYGSYWKHAPPHSYIDVFDFTSVEELANYLVHLSKTPYEYNEYFRWKAQYFVLPLFSARFFTACKLCEILNTQSSFNASKLDLQDWFVKQSDCQSGQSFLISDFIRGKKLNQSYNKYRRGSIAAQLLTPKNK